MLELRLLPLHAIWISSKELMKLTQYTQHYNFSDNLSVLATETLRLEKFSPFILDATSPDTPWLISAYLKVRIFK